MIVNSFLTAVLPGAADGQTKTAAGGQTADNTFRDIMDKATERPKKNELRPREETRKTERPDNTEKRADVRQRDEVNSKPRQKADVRDAKAHDDSVDTEKKESMKSDENKTDKSVESGETQAVAKSEQDGTDENPAEKAVSELVNKISEALGVTVAEVMQLLQTLQIEPQDLSDPGKLTQFMQAAHNVSTPAELLKVDGVTDALKKIKAALNEMEKNLSFKTISDTEAQDSQLSQVPQVTAGEDIQQVAAKAPVLVNQGLAAVETAAEEPVMAEAAEPEQAQAQKATITSNTEAADQEEVQPEQRQASSTVTVVETETEGEQVQQQNAVAATKASISDSAEDPVEGQKMAEDLDIQINTQATGIREGAQLTQGVSRPQAAQRPVNTQDVINQILDRMKVEFKGDISEVRLTLRPQHLGDVTLKVVTENGVVTAQFVAENQRVKEIIESNFNQLKDTLKEQGVEISELQVSVRQQNQDQRQDQLMEEFTRGQQRSGRRIRSILNGIDGIDEVSVLPMASREDEDSNVEYMA